MRKRWGDRVFVTGMSLNTNKATLMLIKEREGRAILDFQGCIIIRWPSESDRYLGGILSRTLTYTRHIRNKSENAGPLWGRRRAFGVVWGSRPKIIRSLHRVWRGCNRSSPKGFGILSGVLKGTVYPRDKCGTAYWQLDVLLAVYKLGWGFMASIYPRLEIPYSGIDPTFVPWVASRSVRVINAAGLFNVR